MAAETRQPPGPLSPHPTASRTIGRRRRRTVCVATSRRRADMNMYARLVCELDPSAAELEHFSTRARCQYIRYVLGKHTRCGAPKGAAS